MSTVSAPPPPRAAAQRRVERVQRRTLSVLVTAQVLSGVGVAIGFAVGALLARELSGRTELSGLAQTAGVLGAAIAAVPLARLAGMRGRRPSLTVGYAVGALGAVLVVLAAAAGWFLLLLAGMALFGAATAANLQSRYAAVDLAEPRRRGRSLSIVVWATTIGAVAGPNLAAPAGDAADRVGLPTLSGAFLWSGVGFCIASLGLFVLLRPDPLLLARDRGGVTERAAHPSLRESLAAIGGSQLAMLGVIAIAVAHTVMVAVMSMTPVHMHGGGADLELVGLVFSVHIAGMYALSPLVGWLVDATGRIPVIAAAIVLLGGSLVLAGTAAPHASLQLSVALFLLGLGWSCALIAGSTLVTEGVALAVRPGAQGAADLVMGLCGAIGGALAGVVVGQAGYGTLAAVSAVPLVGLALACLLASARRAARA
jgi:MFS family permease